MRHRALAGVGLGLIAITAIQAGKDSQKGNPALHQIIQRLQMETNRVNEPAAKVELLLCQAETLGGCGCASEAKSALAQCTDLVLALDAEAKPIAATRMAVAWARLGAAEEAFATVNLLDAATQPFALQTIAETAIEAQQWSIAQQAIEKAGDANLRATLFAQLATAKQQRGPNEDIDRLFEQATAIARDIEDPFLRSEALAVVAEALAKCKRYKQALQLAAEIEDGIDRSLLLSAICNAQCALGDATEALTTARQIEDANARLEALEKVAKAQAANGDIESVLKWMEEEPDPQARCRILLGIAAGSSQRGQPPADTGEKLSESTSGSR